MRAPPTCGRAVTQCRADKRIHDDQPVVILAGPKGPKSHDPAPARSLYSPGGYRPKPLGIGCAYRETQAPRPQGDQGPRERTRRARLPESGLPSSHVFVRLPPPTRENPNPVLVETCPSERRHARPVCAGMQEYRSGFQLKPNSRHEQNSQGRIPQHFIFVVTFRTYFPCTQRRMRVEPGRARKRRKIRRPRGFCVGIPYRRRRDAGRGRHAARTYRRAAMHQPMSKPG